MRGHQLFIDNEWQSALDGRTFEKSNPFTGEVLSAFPAAGRRDAQQAITAASSAFLAWSTTPPVLWRELFLKAADVLHSHQAEIANTMAEEMGGTFGWGY
jgi:acyl-CoA reductase-like NAD-dependent aldehyde dehydrogenase